VAYFPSGILLNYSCFGWHTLLETTSTGNIAIRVGILYFRNIVKILLFQVAYFGREKTLPNWPFGGAYLAKKPHGNTPLSKGIPTCQKNTEICVVFYP
jgi:hypothetical protein